MKPPTPSPHLFLLLSSLLSTVTVTATASPDCGTTQQCKLSCKDGAYMPLDVAGREIYLCAPAPDKTWSDWYVGDCGGAGDLGEACAQLSGQVKCDKCVFEIPAGRSQNDVFRIWRRSCNEPEPAFGASVSNPKTYEDAVGEIWCPPPPPPEEEVGEVEVPAPVGSE